MKAEERLELQKEFESTGYSSWINSDLYFNGKIYTQEYTEWLEKIIHTLRAENAILKTEKKIYAKLQIEKDRLRIKEQLYTGEWQYVDDTPIILD